MIVDVSINEQIENVKQEVLNRLMDNKEDEEQEDFEMEKEEAEFCKLRSMIPQINSKTVSQLDIVLEAITYINILNNRLLDGHSSEEDDTTINMD